MSEPKFTPGPWVVSNTDKFSFGVKKGNGTESIGRVYGPSFPERSEVGQRALADACLIASSPDLYAALEHLLHNARASGAEMGLALDVADAALAKARGEG